MSTAVMIVLAFVAIFFITLILKGVRIVPEQSAVMIERLGKFRTQLDAGLNIIIPVIDQPRSVPWRLSWISGRRAKGASLSFSRAGWAGRL